MGSVVDVHAHVPVDGAFSAPLLDLDIRLAAMQAQGVDVQVVSVLPRHSPHREGPGESAERVQVINAAVAALARRCPDHIVGLATVASHHPALAAEQLRHAVDDYDFRGVQLVVDDRSVDLTGPELAPFWAMVEALDVVVFVRGRDCGLSADPGQVRPGPACRLPDRCPAAVRPHRRCHSRSSRVLRRRSRPAGRGRPPVAGHRRTGARADGQRHPP